MNPSVVEIQLSLRLCTVLFWKPEATIRPFFIQTGVTEYLILHYNKVPASPALRLSAAASDGQRVCRTPGAALPSCEWNGD